MKNIVVIFGGKSVEHDISILTGLHAAKHVVGYTVHLVYLTRENQMLTGGMLANIEYYTSGRGRAKPCFFMDGALWRKGFRAKKLGKVDAVLNCCHGGAGENGELAALFSVLGIPITSCGYVAAAAMQSKTRTKEILTAAGILQVKYLSVTKADAADPIVFNSIRAQLGEKVIVKPDNLGSSIGITLAETEDELKDALELAFTLDKRVIIEEYLESVDAQGNKSNIREINCSAYRVGGKVHVSGCELIKNDKAIFDYETKYLDGNSGFIKKGKGKKEKVRDIEESVESEIRKLTETAYELFGASGVVRADFMVQGGGDGDDDGGVVARIYLNEINTVPGFLSYHLWLRGGLPYGVLIDMVVKQAIADSKKELETVFKSDILEKNRGLVEM